MIKDFINDCESCKKNTIIKHTKAPIQITNTPTRPLQFIQLNTVGPLKVLNGYRYILMEKFILIYGCFDTVKIEELCL